MSIALLSYSGKNSFFIFLNQTFCFGYSKEPSQCDGSFEHPKHMLKMINKKIMKIVELFLLIHGHSFFSAYTGVGGSIGPGMMNIPPVQQWATEYTVPLRSNIDVTIVVITTHGYIGNITSRLNTELASEAVAINPSSAYVVNSPSGNTIIFSQPGWQALICCMRTTKTQLQTSLGIRSV